jgi:hypothetical protein
MAQLLRSRPNDHLRAALARIVATDASIGRARTILLQPLDVLASLAREVEGVLHDDDAAMERLRRGLSMVGGWAMQLLDAVQGRPEPGVASGNHLAAASSSEAETHETRPCASGIVDLGELMLLALAASRVGRRAGDPISHVRTIEALALAAAPAESLARGLSEGLSDDQAAALLSVLATTDSIDARLPALVPTLLDDCERARWSCVQILLAEVLELTKYSWETTYSHVIAGVVPRNAGMLEVHFHPEDPRFGVKGKALLEALQPQGGATAKFVFVTGDGRTIEAPAKSAAPTKLTARVVVPEGAKAGWIGVATDDSKLAAKEARIGLRHFWIQRNIGPCLIDQPVDIARIPEIDGDVALPPPRSHGARWGVQIVDHWIESAKDGVVTPGIDARLAAVLSGADEDTTVEVTVDGAPVTATLEHGRVGATIPAAAVSDGAQVRIAAFRTREGQPDDTRAFSMRVAGAPKVPLPGARDVVLLAPVFVQGDRVRRVETNLAQAGDIAVRKLPWIGAGELVFDQIPRSPNDPAALIVLERLATIAARTPGIEHAIVVALIPGDEHFALVQPAEGAHAIAIATRSAAAEVLTEPLPQPRPVAQRLRIIGRIHRDDVVIDEPVRVEERPAGARAPYLTHVLAVAVDAAGRELVSERISTHAASRTGTFAVLLPIGPGVAAVELRTRPELLAVELRAQPQAVAADFRALGTDVASTGRLPPTRVFERPVRFRGGPMPVLDRPAGAPTIREVAFVPPAAASTSSRAPRPAIRWRYEHSHGVRARIEVEVGRGGMWSRIAVSDSTRGRVDLPLRRRIDRDRLDAVRVVGSDGWNTTVESVLLPAPDLDDDGSPRMLIRRLPENRFFVESDRPIGRVTWTFQGVSTELDPDQVFVVEGSSDADTLAVTADGGLADSIEIGDIEG